MGAGAQPPLFDRLDRISLPVLLVVGDEDEPFRADDPTAALAGAMHGIFNPIIRPGIASSHMTIAALLMILMGGIGTLNGALLGAALFKLLSFFLEKWFGGASQVIVGLVYILLVLFMPYGIVGTYQRRALDIKAGRERLLRFFRKSKG